MKLLIEILIAACSLLWTSCSVYEDVTFSADGQIEYQLNIDATELAKNIPNFSSQMAMPADTTIAFADILKGQIDTSGLSIEEITKLNYLSPLSMSFSGKNESMSVKLFGNFDNLEKFNNAFESLHELANKGSKSESVKSKIPVDPTTLTLMQQVSVYSWDATKKTMTRVTKTNTDSGNRIQNDESLSRLFFGGKLIVNYHFPTLVDKVNNPDAKISDDGKTVSVEYPAEAFLRTLQETDIEVRLK